MAFRRVEYSPGTLVRSYALADLRGEVLGRIASRMQEAIRSYLSSRFPGKRFSSSVRVYAVGDRIAVELDDKFLKALNDGTKPRIMSNLVGKTVPIRTESGVVFRKVTAASIARGGWRHPGTPGEHFVEQEASAVLEDSTEEVSSMLESTVGLLLESVLEGTT